MNKYYTTMTDTEYRQKLSEVNDLATNYAKSGFGYTTLRTAFNELCERSGANHAVDNDIEQIKLGRRIIAERISIDTLARLPTEVNRKLMADLIDIANTDAPGIQHSRHMWR